MIKDENIELDTKHTQNEYQYWMSVVFYISLNLRYCNGFCNLQLF